MRKQGKRKGDECLLCSMLGKGPRRVMKGINNAKTFINWKLFGWGVFVPKKSFKWLGQIIFLV